MTAVMAAAVMIIAVMAIMTVTVVIVRGPELGVPRLAREVVGQASLEGLELVQHLITVEGADVTRLNRGQAPNRPAEVHEVRLDRMRQGMHPDLLGQAIALPRVAGAAR